MQDNQGQRRVFLVLRKMVDAGIIPVEKVRGNPNINPKKTFTEVLEYLIKDKIADENKVKEFFVKFLGYKPFDKEVHKIDIEKSILEKITPSFMTKNKIVPFAYENNTLKVAMLNPTDKDSINQIKFFTGVKFVDVYIATLSEIENLYREILALMPAKSMLEEIKLDVEVSEEQEAKEQRLEEISSEAEESPIVKLSRAIIVDAIGKGASDVHIEPMEKVLRVRYRIDGILKTVAEYPPSVKDALAARYKIMANLDISEKRLPQDGRIRIIVNRKKYDLRVSILPVVYGEKIVMRIQDAESYLNVKLEDLGFEDDDLKIFREGIYSPWGMVLVTCPTGSGKTTTLYSALMERNKDDVNIMTAEDPVEVSIFGINQVQVKEEIGLTFAAVLRSFLRQDPDIILVGEIRDRETAEIAVKAALTGHLVFSTLHTNDAPSTITRLIDIGVDRFLVSTAVHTIVAQRLIRKLCSNCKQPANYPPELLKSFGFSDEDIKEGQFFVHNPKGCEKCNGTGYKGRTAVHEILKLTDDIRKLIISGKSADDIRDYAVQQGMKTLYKDGLIKMKKGLTDIAEIERVLMK
ncbi:ATPase, T2SS/T4P/T4SS family [Sulfurihydrogenibium sp.]|uniref:GspE/PulE family protein n=1 Tax=Sulfurihydrogenibium sp. TaxID=2053621 RepID=UPI00262D603C|nr:ATPase, T2SS/T4P/T4SS family [Sulfurihydrogenibium sp.]